MVTDSLPPKNNAQLNCYCIFCSYILPQYIIYFLNMRLTFFLIPLITIISLDELFLPTGKKKKDDIDIYI